MAKIMSAALRRRYEQLKGLGLGLDITRGKPSGEQNRIALPMLDFQITVSPHGADCLDYGCIEGLPEARELFGAMLGTPPEQTFVFGGGSLGIMQGLIAEALLRPLPGETMSWATIGRLLGQKPAMLCPVPGYDRHHNICKLYGIEMIPVPMLEDGPDMDVVCSYVRDPSVVGMWCIPKYHNPTGWNFSPAVMRRLAWLKTSSWFRLIWDLAYVVHDHTEAAQEMPNMLKLCRAAQHEDRVFVIGSTSKITFPDVGLGILAGSAKNMAWVRESQFTRSIGSSKLTQLQHVLLLQDIEGIHAHMRRHRAILAPKFALVQEVLARELARAEVATWSDPHGGYFVGLWLKRGSARNVIDRCAAAGLKVTPAGSCHIAADDSFIRIAPTFPSIEALKSALEILTTSVLMEAEAK